MRVDLFNELLIGGSARDRDGVDMAGDSTGSEGKLGGNSDRNARWCLDGGDHERSSDRVVGSRSCTNDEAGVFVLNVGKSSINKERLPLWYPVKDG